MNILHRYTTLNEILESETIDSIKDKFETAFNQQVYFELNDNCRVGVLVGLADVLLDTAEEKIEQFYIVKIGEEEILIPIWKSLTKL